VRGYEGASPPSGARGDAASDRVAAAPNELEAGARLAAVDEASRGLPEEGGSPVVLGRAADSTPTRPVLRPLRLSIEAQGLARLQASPEGVRSLLGRDRLDLRLPGDVPTGERDDVRQQVGVHPADRLGERLVAD